MTTTHRPSTRIIVMALVAALLLVASPAPANAAQGEVVVSDGDVASHVVGQSGKARVTFDQNSILNSCPVGLNACFLEYRWRSKKNCLICWWADDTPWTVLGTGTTQLSHCKANGAYRFELQVRMRWYAQQTQTVRMFGRHEYQFEIDASVPVNRLIPIRLFNVSTNSGLTTSYLLQTNTGQSAQGAIHTMATSGANYLSITCP